MFDSIPHGLVAAINSVGTVTLAIQYSVGIFVIFFARRYARFLRWMMVACLVICVLSMLISSFSTKVWSCARVCTNCSSLILTHFDFEVWHLILLQGIVYGTSGGLLYTPYIIWVDVLFNICVMHIID